ncbi:TPA: hypothetical protein DDZ86_03965 [Candidatus Dependentiae bacterium]|nr:MAG: hypothetical protein UW09_C0003G0146 [candidate division TM6 bacterium GW2011_GWF2_43_87]HBL98772.1 hypothetical protein [Candidatus Dependentiae bacterium]
MKIKLSLLLAVLSLGCAQNFFGMLSNPNSGSNGGPNQPRRPFMLPFAFSGPQTFKQEQTEKVEVLKIPLLYGCRADIVKTTFSYFEKVAPENGASSSSTSLPGTINININKQFHYPQGISRLQYLAAYQQFLSISVNTQSQN